MNLNFFHPKILVLLATVSLSFGYGCSSTPSERDGKKVLQNKIQKIYKGLAKISNFNKTNAQEGEIFGVKGYLMEYEATLEYLENACVAKGVGGNPILGVEVYEPQKGGCKKGAKPGTFVISFYSEGTLKKKGAKEIFKGELAFEKTEKGWKGEDKKIY